MSDEGQKLRISQDAVSHSQPKRRSPLCARCLTLRGHGKSQTNTCICLLFRHVLSLTSWSSSRALHVGPMRHVLSLHVEAQVPQCAARSDAHRFHGNRRVEAPSDVKLFPSFTLPSPNATQNNVQDGSMSRRSPGVANSVFSIEVSSPHFFSTQPAPFTSGVIPAVLPVEGPR
jgi:hypothetical protein